MAPSVPPLGSARRQWMPKFTGRVLGVGLATSLAIAALVPSGLPLVAQSPGQRSPESGSAASTPPPALRIVQLLWKTQKASAAAALEKLVEQSLARGQVAALRPHLAQMAERLTEALDDPSDPRWVASVAALAIAGQPSGMAPLRAAVEGTQAASSVAVAANLPPAKREFLLRAWLQADPQSSVAWVHEALRRAGRPAADAPWLTTVALMGLEADRQSTTRQLIEQWADLPKALQVTLIEPLTQQADSMRQLVDAVAAGKISKDMLNTNQLVKWSSGNDPELRSAIEQVWGKLRVAEDADRKAIVARTLKLLRSGKIGHPVAGEQVFKRVCSQCHRLHGEGVEVGPDISSNGRGSFEQLVSNVLDPSLVIGNAFMAKTVLTADGQVLAGLVAAEDPQRITLKTQGGKLIELDREEDIDQIKDSVKSLMPDGLEQQMNEQELVDLFAYLSLVRPLTADENDTIPGTPAKLLDSAAP